MNADLEKCRGLSDEELTKELQFLAARERRSLGSLLAHLAEYDRRRLAEKTGRESTYMYCVRALKCDEGGAYRRVHAARVVRRYPDVLPQLADGSLTLTSLLLLSPILTEENHSQFFREASGKTKRELEVFVAGHDPRPARPDLHRRLPAPPPWSAAVCAAPSDAVALPGSGHAAAPEMPDVVPAVPPKEWQAMVPLSFDRVRIGFDAALAVLKLIERARQVLRHKYPDGRLEDVVKDALEVFLDRKDPQRRLGFKPAAALVKDAPGPETGTRRMPWETRSGRYIPARVKREVWQRDGGRCAWRDAEGTVCGSKDWIEFDHVLPFAKGGRSDSPRNVRLLCRLHNQEAARAAFGVSAGGGIAAGSAAGGTTPAAAGSPA